jgi:Zn-dependent M16 (insulinase) family peptidase
MAAVSGFTCIAERTIPELGTRARLFRHQRTGAELLSLENHDENKSFGVAFRTLPANSSGAPHILEHMLLGGSHKYPLKDPFFALLNGSLATFLNAVTYPDKTIYPTASTNLSDFYNLVDVYLDLVFAPLLRPERFLQEAWHYERESAGALNYTGVVFNEMKGMLSSPDLALGYVHTSAALFPDTPYRLNFGGDPRHIPELSYDQLVAFYRAHYHPANARIMFWGDDPPETRLRLIDERLATFEAGAPAPFPPLQAPFAQPRRVEASYDAGDAAARPMVGIAWALPVPEGPTDMLATRVLNHLLLGTPAAPLCKALLDANLGEGLIDDTFLGEERLQPCLALALRGVDPARVDEVEPVVLATLARLAAGLDPDTVAAALHTIEFRLREKRRGNGLDSQPGIVMMMNALGAWLYGRDPLAALAFAEPFADLRARAAAGPFFERLIARLLLENSHRATIVVRPDPEHNARLAADERARLTAAQAAMSEDEARAHTRAVSELHRWQEAPDPPERLACLPRLALTDLERTPKSVRAETLGLAAARALYYDLPTGGIGYVDVGFDLGVLPPHLLPYAAILGRLLLETGAGADDAVRLGQRIGRETGGLRAEIFIGAAADEQSAVAYLFLRGKALAERGESLAAILRDVLTAAHFDNHAQVRQAVQAEKSAREALLAGSDAELLRTRLHARLTSAGWAAEQTRGMEGLRFLRRLATRIDEDWPRVLAELEAARTLIVRRGGLTLGLSADNATRRAMAPWLTELAAALPDASATRAAWSPPPGPRAEGLISDTQVNGVAKGADLRALGYQPGGATLVANSLIANRWLFEQVRMKGGAYGGWSEVDERTGIYHAQSYHDPNLRETIDAFDRAGAFLREVNLDEDSLTRSIIATVRDSDPYRLPEARGYAALCRTLTGETDEQRRALRESILSTTAGDVRAVAEALDAVAERGVVVVLGSQTAIEGEASARPNWIAVNRA